MSKNRARSFKLRLPLPSAMFSGIDWAARKPLIASVAMQSVECFGNVERR